MADVLEHEMLNSIQAAYEQVSAESMFEHYCRRFEYKHETDATKRNHLLRLRAANTEQEKKKIARLLAALQDCATVVARYIEKCYTCIIL